MLPSLESFSSHLSSLKEKVTDQMIVAATRLLIYGSYFGLSTMVALKYWPQKHYSEKFFEVGKLYKFRSSNVWYTLWTEQVGSNGKVNRTVLYRMKPGTVFMVLSVRPNIPTTLDVEILVDEKRAVFSIEGEQTIQPWQFFDRIRPEEDDEPLGTEDDLP